MHGAYWTVDNRATYSKVQALYWAGGNKSKIKFYFFDREWANNNWSLPPVKSLQQLIKERCESLRAETNHLTVWLSSGYDSVTILDNFAQYNIPIDELCIYKRCGEDLEYLLAFAIAKDYKDTHNPNCIITDVELGIEQVRQQYQTPHDDIFWTTGLGVRINKTSTCAVGNQVLTAHSPINNYSDRLDVYGVEKPRVTLYNGSWYAMMPDSVLIDAINVKARGFWLDFDCWELYHSTCWNAIAWMETLPGLDENLVHVIQSNNPQYYAAWNLSVGRTPVTNSYSHSALGKKLFRPGMLSPNTLQLVGYFQTHEGKIWNHYTDNLLTLQKIVGKEAWSNITDDFPLSNFTVCSENKFLRPLTLQHE